METGTKQLRVKANIHHTGKTLHPGTSHLIRPNPAQNYFFQLSMLLITLRQKSRSPKIRASFVKSASPPFPFKNKKLPNEPILEFSICLQTKEIINKCIKPREKTNPFLRAKTDLLSLPVNH
jgi:hypothetical protein